MKKTTVFTLCGLLLVILFVTSDSGPRFETITENRTDLLVPVTIFIRLPEETRFEMHGSGVLTGTNGVLTVTHIFDKKWRSAYFMIRISAENRTPLYINSVRSLVPMANLKQSEVVACEVGLTPKLIDCFYEELLTVEENYTLLEARRRRDFKSLTGESAESVAVKARQKGLAVHIVNYHSVQGQSGKGFLDQKGRLYLLDASTELRMEKKTAERYGITEKSKFSIFVGPIPY